MIAVVIFSLLATAADKKVKVPTIIERENGVRSLQLPDDVDIYLQTEFPGYRIPKDSEYNPDMLSYYNYRLIGVHPAVAWGDFNGDGKRDYSLLIITSEGKLGPLMELVALNGRKKTGGDFDVFRLGEVYNFKDDYVSFVENKLTKGKYKKGAWYINWDKKKNVYVVTKS